jgi:hypothetical protein
MLLSENIVDKQRVMSSILKSERFHNKKEGHLHIMLKDVGSLLGHTAFSFERLEFLQDTFTDAGFLGTDALVFSPQGLVVISHIKLKFPCRFFCNK